MTPVDLIASRDNVVPSRYRQVSVQPYAGAMTAAAITAHLVGKAAYRRTRYVVLEHPSACAVAIVERAEAEALFSPITAVSILALPDTCRLVEDATVDTANPTALAAKARTLGVGAAWTLVVRGLDSHVNFIHRPNPHTIEVVDVVPPAPPKLLRMVRQVLSYADLPPVVLEEAFIDLRDLREEAPEAEAYLVPCRASGLDFEQPTYFLDEHPARHAWTMLACERSRQIHRHFYGEEAPCVELCPRLRAPETTAPQLIKCCLLEEQVVVEGQRVVVPWGADLSHVEHALQILVTLHRT